MTTWLTTIFHAMSQPLKWWVVVAPWEQGIRVRLGKEAIVLNPGMHFRIPFLDRIYVQSIRLRIVTSSSHTVSTLDKKAVTLKLAVRFAIRDIKQLYLSISDPEATLLNYISTLAAEYISQRHNDKLSHNGLQDYVNRGMVDKNWGLSNISASITDFAITRTYRFVMNDYEGTTGLNLDHNNHGLR